MRMMRPMPAQIVTAALCLLPMPLLAQGGKWSPDQLPDFAPEDLAALGLKLPVQDLWDKEGGGGLLEATVQIPGCSASFVSAKGLAITNHHCVDDVLQLHSSPENDLVRQGYLAAAPAAELPATGMRAFLPHGFRDVSQEIAAAIPKGADDRARFLAIDRKKKELVATCEAGGARRCQVATFDDGVRYVLIEQREYADVRLVWAPPAALANFGGEIDNFSWPRHSADAALLRIWARPDGSPAPHQADNVPLQPKRFFKLAQEGAQDGDFVMVTGYPGRSYRSTVHAEMVEWAELFFPERAKLYRHSIDLLEAESQKSEVARIRLVSRIRDLANREKAARGQIEGIRRGDLLTKKLVQEQAFRAWAEARAEEKDALSALDALTARAAERPRGDWQREYLLGELRASSRSLAMAVAVARWALERQKPDAGRSENYQDRKLAQTRDEHRRDQKTLHIPAERALLIDYLEQLLTLPEAYRVAAVESRFRSPEGRAGLAATVDGWLANTPVHDEEQRLVMLGETEGVLRARRDPFLDFAFELAQETVRVEEAKESREGAFSRERPPYRRALARFLGRPLDADANNTLRVSFAKIEGYSPRDGLYATPRTTLRGLIAKNRNAEPFEVPPELLAIAEKARTSRFADPKRGDLPIDFLATADTTGGNSGSPVLDGQGRLVGLNFDRVWENVANDFGYNPEVARNVCVDIRYVLFLLENLSGEAAQGLLGELGAR